MSRVRSCLILLVLAFAAGGSGCIDFERFRVVTEDAGRDAGEGEADAGEIGDAGGAGDAGSTPPVDAECTNDEACEDVEFCNGDWECESRRPNAQDCGGATQCLSGYCDPDGICCTAGEDCCDTDSECSGEYRCDVAARECFSECTTVNETVACKTAGYCSAALHCVSDLTAGAANACTRDAMCAGNANCVDGYCCNGGCAGCFVCNAAGSLGTCQPAGAGADPKNACAATGCATDGWCNGAGACRGVAAGTDPNSACTATACSNDGSCNGSGACRVVPIGTDPNGYCSGTTGSCDTGVCNGGGVCTPKADGTTCGGGNCGSARCSGGGCTDACSYSGEAACEYCNGDAVYVCGGC